MTNVSLAQSYLVKGRVRLKIVDLALKGMLRQAGIEPPHWHDVGGLLKEYAARFAAVDAEEIDRLASVSAWLRKERRVHRRTRDSGCAVYCPGRRTSYRVSLAGSPHEMWE